MESIQFRLSGTGATFKRPHINSVNLSYSNIHKTALLGLFGAILGMKGHRHKEKTEMFPAFYEALKGLKVSIMPVDQKLFQKENKQFTETTGFYNKGGATSVVKEQFLIEPEWIITVLQGSCKDEIYKSLTYALVHNEAVYEPFLGKNHFFAEINEVKVLEINKVNEVRYIHSLFPYDEFEVEEPLDTDKEYFCLREFMPIRFTPFLNHYHEEEMCLTNFDIVNYPEDQSIMTDGQFNLYFI